MAEHEGDILLGTAVGEPVPGEQALDADDNAVAEGGDRLEQGLEVTGEVLVEDDGAGGIQNAPGEKSLAEA